MIISYPDFFFIPILEEYRGEILDVQVEDEFDKYDEEYSLEESKK